MGPGDRCVVECEGPGRNDQEHAPDGDGAVDRGAGLVEYILLVALIALAVVSAVVFVRGQVATKFAETGVKLSTNGADEPIVCGAWITRDEVSQRIVQGINDCGPFPTLPYVIE